MKTLIVLVLAVGAMADCDSEIEDFARCMLDGMEDRKGEKTERRAAITACFTDNGCTDPSQKKERKECVSSVLQSEVMGQLNSCTSDKGFTIPEDMVAKIVSGEARGLYNNKGGKKEGGRGWGKGKGKGKGKNHERWMARKEARKAKKAERKAERQAKRQAKKESKMAKKAERKAQKLEKRLSKFCEGGDAEAARSCVLSIQSEAQEGRKEKKKERKMGRMLLMAECGSQLSPDCRESMKQRKRDLCECGQSLAEDDELLERLGDQIQGCRDEDADTDTEADADTDVDTGTDDDARPKGRGNGKGKGRGKGKGKGRGKGKLRKMVRALCGKGKGRGKGKGKGKGKGRRGKGKGKGKNRWNRGET